MSYRVGSKTDGSSGAQNSYSVQSKNVAPKPDAYAGKDGGSNADATIVKQDENTIGLLVTDQLDEAIQRCKERVEDIAQNCRARNQKFRDIEFDLDNGKDLCLFGLNTDNRTHYPADVMRVTDIFKEPTFFVDGPSFSDIAQGRDGDCYFLAALAMVATLPGLLEKICVARDQVVGVYGFIFFRDGLWQEVIIDDQLFVSVQPWGDLDETTKGLYQEDPYIYDSIARKGSKVLYFAKSMNDNETWVPLIEKAYAKFYGNYTYISGGYTMEAVEDLTGGTSTLYMLKDFIDTSSLWEEFTRKERRDKLYACSFLQSSKWSGAHGLYTGHAYSILRAAEYNGKKFVIIRNPWGKGEWEGAWADGSKEWTNEWLPALEVLDHKFGNDGEFVMEFSDFLRQWQCLDCARLYDSSWVVSNIWVTLNGLNLNHPWTWGDVSFTIHVDAPTPAVIVLQQLDTRSFQEISGTVSYDFDFVVFKKGSKRVYASSAYNFFGTRSRNAEVNFEAGEYVVHVRIDSSKNEGYLDESSETWDSRMLKRLMSKKTVAFSKALNATTDKHDSTIPIDLSLLAGSDLNEVEISLVKAKREEEQSKKKAREAVKRANTTDDDIAKVAKHRAEQAAEKTWEGESATGGTIIHKDMKCDVCQTSPIVGVRYHCNNSACPDFDMCQDCFNKKSHDKAHDLLVYSVARPLTHAGIQCSTCEPKEEVAGVLFKCLVEGCTRQYSCKPCMDKTPHEASHTLLMVPAPEATQEAEKAKAKEKETAATHEGIGCDGCGTSPIVGIRYKCLETSCPNFDLCDKCMKRGVHPASHHMLPIVESDEAKFLNPAASEGTTTTVLGLRVYTQKSAPSVLEAQLRHGSLRTK